MHMNLTPDACSTMKVQKSGCVNGVVRALYAPLGMTGNTLPEVMGMACNRPERYFRSD